MPENGMSVNWLLANLFCKTGVDRVLRFLIWFILYEQRSCFSILRSAFFVLRAELSEFFASGARGFLWAKLFYFVSGDLVNLLFWIEFPLFLSAEIS